MKEAFFFRNLDDNKVQCTLCPHSCVIKEGKLGTCGVRRNSGGTLYSEVYGKISAIHFDPIEKKPLYHFHPGSIILSIGTIGCNLKCSFCQNCDISQVTVDEYKWFKNYTIDEILDIASGKPGNIGISFTYNEPAIFYEFMMETAEKTKERKMKTTMVSNGYINPEPLNELIPYMDAFNIDLKAFRNEFYKTYTKSSLEPVLNTLKTIRDKGKHLEITNLVIPTLNDDPAIFSEMIDWIYNELGEFTVFHLSRYFPHHKMNIPSTPVSTLKELFDIAREKLKFVYLGNLHNSEGQNTWCPECGSELINRVGYYTTMKGITSNGRCKNCDAVIQNLIL